MAQVGSPLVRTCAAARLSMTVSLPADCTALLRRLRRIGAPLVLLQLVAWAFLSGIVNGEIDGAEFFAGDMAVTTKLQEAGFTCFPFELKLDAVCHDILSDPGFAFAVALVCRVRSGGFVWFGIVCSTWVFMSRSSTGRDLNHPLGRATSLVTAANVMTSRVLLLFWLAAARGCFVILEQPSTSLMYMHPRFQELIGQHARGKLSRPILRTPPPQPPPPPK